MTGLVAGVQALVPLGVLLVVGRAEAVRDDNEGSTPMCLPHTPASPLLTLGPGKEEPTYGPGPSGDSEKHHMPCKRMEVLLCVVWDFPHNQVLQCKCL